MPSAPGGIRGRSHPRRGPCPTLRGRHHPAYAATSASDCKYDFDAIIVLQLKLIVPAAWDDFPVDLDRDTPVGQPHAVQQGGDRHRSLETFFLTVEQDLHELGKTSGNRKTAAFSAVIVIPALE